MGLVTEDIYIRLTGDTASFSDDIAFALTDAQATVEKELKRPLTAGTYQEQCRVFTDGACYPSVPNLTTVTIPSGAVVQGASVLAGTFDNPVNLSYDWWYGVRVPKITLTYTAGWSAQTLPVPLRNAIAKTAYNALHPVLLVGVPANADSVKLGDVALSSTGPLQTLKSLDETTRRSILPYKYRLDGTFGPPVLLP